MISVRCKKCGNTSDGSHLFCRECGEKLDFSALEKKYRRGHRGGGNRAIRVLLFLLFTSALFLLLWPEMPSGAMGTKEEGLAFYRKLVKLDHAARRGSSVSETIYESGLNSYFSELVRKSMEKEAENGAKLQLRDINVRFTADHFTALIRADWGPLKLSYLVAGHAGTGPDSEVVQIDTVKMGHLIIPGALKDWMASRIAILFSNRKRERIVYERITSLGINEGAADLGLN